MDNTSVEPQDCELTAAYASTGDAGVFHRLVVRHIDFVYASAARQLGDRDLAEDVAQAVFLLLAQKAAKIKPDAYLKGWLFNATRHIARNARRAEVRRKFREREAATMRSEIEPDRNQGIVSLHLDSALASLGAKDRTALLLRYFDQSSNLDVGRVLGVSPQAAAQRVSRALRRLRSILARRGIEIPADAMAGALGVGLMGKAPAHLVAAASELGANAVAAHSGLPVALAKSASQQMWRGKLSIVTAKFVLAAACAAAAATVAVETPHLSPPRSRAILADVAAPAAPATQPDAEYQACQQVLQSIVDAYDNEDPSAADAMLYFGPDADPHLVRTEPQLLQVDIVSYRVQKDAVAKFGAHAMSLNTYSNIAAAMFDELLARLEPKDYQLTDDTLVIKPPAPFLSHRGAWPRAPIYFHKVGNDWKLDAGKTFKVVFHVRRRIPKPGETQEQTESEYMKALIDGFTNVAEDIEQNNIISAAEVQRRLDGVIIGSSMQYSEFSVNLVPKEMAMPDGHL